MFSKLLLASVASIGLLLAGPPKASAQVVYACVSSIGNIAVVASASASCPPAVGGTTWTKVSLNTVQAGADYQCVPQQTVPASSPVTFLPSMGGVKFGSAISTTGTPPFSSFMLQPGTYQIHLSGLFNLVSPVIGLPFNTPIIQAQLNGNPVAQWLAIGSMGGLIGTVVGDRLISVAALNSQLLLIIPGGATVPAATSCELVITKVQ